MNKVIKKICAAVCCAAVSAVFAITAAAEYSFPFTDCYIEGGAIQGAAVAEEVRISGTIDTEEKLITATYALSGDELDLSFWQTEGATISCEVMLETEGADVYACMPGFGDGWVWIDPSSRNTLKAGEWITVTETMEHFYNTFKDNAPSRVLVQVRSNTQAEQEITVAFRNFRINGVDGAEDTSSAESAQAPESGEVITPAQTDTSTPAQTEVTAQTTPATTIDYSQYLQQPDKNDLTVMIVIIVVIAVVVIAAGVVGYIIYKKRKYY